MRYMALLLASLMLLAACEVDDAGDDVVIDDPDVAALAGEDDEAVDEPTATPQATPTQEPEPTPTQEPEPTETPEPEPTATPEARGPPSGEVAFYHFDVGQADATLIQAPEATILIDAGDWQRADVVPHLQSAGVESIDLFILTHPHADHIGQVPQVMDTFPVTEVWMSGWEHDSQTFGRVLDAVLESDAGYHEPRVGETETFGDLIVEVIHPVDPLADIHDNIAVRISFGDFAAVYTGDAESQHESEIMSRGHDLSAQVLQLGHHGSSTSTTGDFLSAISPEVAIYSAGAGNTYGHPHAEVVERVQGAGVHLYGTDVHGTVIVRTDGETFTIEVEREGDIEAAQPEPTPEPEADPEPDPQPGAAGVEFISVTGGPPGGQASTTVQTSAGATCSIRYVTPAGTVSSAQGLVEQTAGADGVASWSWNIGPNTRPGTGTVTVTCDGQSVSSPITIQ